MLNNWLKPLSATFLKQLPALPKHSVGQNILQRHDGIPDLKKVKAALIGIHEKEANDIRRFLYSYAWPFPENTVADLGNLRKTDPLQLVPVIYELLSGKIIPILFGGSDEHVRGQFLAYQEAKALVNLTLIDEKPRMAEGEPYASILSPRHPMLFHAGLIGLQSHNCAPDAMNLLKQQHTDIIRLGKSRQSLEETEPVIRDADLVVVHLSALKQSEAPGVALPSPSGYIAEEICQLCRYAGMSDKLSSFGTYGYAQSADQAGQTAQINAQMLWYFLEGVFNRKGDYPASLSGLTEYVVDFRKLHYQLTFWKSVKSGRWWMQVPVATKKKHERHRLVPCSFQDYQAACREELPERLFAALGRFG